MTVRVLGMWETGWNVPSMEYDQWQYVCKDYEVDRLVMTPITGMQGAGPLLNERTTMDQMITQAVAAGLTLVFLDLAAPTVFDHDTVHPEDAAYIFGKANSSAYATYFDGPRGDLAWKIPGPDPTPAGFWPHQALSIVLYERFKQWP